MESPKPAVRSASRGFLYLVIVLFAGCGTKEPEGVREYREVTDQALTAMHGTMKALDKVAAETERCPPKTFAVFGNAVQRLEVDSIRIRERAQAIRARGDAYFAAWSENIAKIEDPVLRKRAEEFHPQLEQSFSKIKMASDQAGAAFKPFQAGLRQLRIRLEADPAAIQNESVKKTLSESREKGDEVAGQLNTMKAELDLVKRMLTKGKT